MADCSSGNPLVANTPVRSAIAPSASPSRNLSSASFTSRTFSIEPVPPIVPLNAIAGAMADRASADASNAVMSLGMGETLSVVGGFEQADRLLRKLSHLSAMPQRVICENARHHRFADGDCADADARVV